MAEEARINALIDEFQHNDLAVRLNAFQNITTVATALGPQRTKAELVPYLNEFTDDEDDVLLVLSDQLGALTQFLPDTESASVLLEALEALAKVEESAVRIKAMGATMRVAKQLSVESIVLHMLPMFRRLCTGQYFTLKVSAVMLFPSMYERVSDNHKTEIRAMFVRLCKDPAPAVRRASCQMLGTFSASLPVERVRDEMFPALALLAKDEQDSVRLLVPKALVPVAAKFKDSPQSKMVLGHIVALCKDRSWRVRFTAATHFCSLWEAVGVEPEEVDNTLNGFVQLMQDSEVEVRTEAATKVAMVAKLAGPMQTNQKLLTPIQALVHDGQQCSRAAIASVIMGVASLVYKKDVFDHLLPLFLELFKDPDSEVRLNIIDSVYDSREVIPIELLTQTLLPAVAELGTDPKWRTRLKIIQHVPHLAQQLKKEFFETKLSSLCMNWLGDSVFTIREAATKNLAELARVFGVAWAKVNIVPKLVSLSSHKSYLYRMTALFAIKDISAAVGVELTTSLLLAVLLKLAADPVPNVRFNVSRSLKALVPHMVPSTLTTHVIPTLRTLAEDPDRDVKFFAEEALLELPSLTAQATPATSTPSANTTTPATTTAASMDESGD